jgi:hypothetical protein
VRSRLATIIFAAVFTAALVLAPGAAAENYQYKIVPKDKAAAAAAVLKRGDLNGLPGWTGGAVPPDRTAETNADRCNGYLPKQSDLVVTGDAETKYSLQGTTIDTQIQLLRTPAMVATDWHRSIEIPDYVSCAKEQFQKQLPKTERFVSLTRLPYSTFGTKSVAFRTLFDVLAGGRKIRVAVDFIGFYRGRTEVSVIISGAAPTANDLMALKALDLKVADTVSAKVPAG